eukprot:CAMPEP_0201593230 /NCGR_PEP_ID=MMETSP0190_2-20130828/190899_1 /ASSEMBLY_ACC=CAM_ASM_000263 /TAXON_ID=37353 /ORGANISM="Rosalina sp." /LENGTH=70 /DNA_ID=CAMNT_0048052347 /DNA_START=508 /DNA_END=720 /DNA_ORIENTATION=+
MVLFVGNDVNDVMVEQLVDWKQVFFDTNDVNVVIDEMAVDLVMDADLQTFHVVVLVHDDYLIQNDLMMMV